LNIEGYWEGVLAWVKRSVEEGFVSAVNKDILVECKDVTEVMGALRRYRLSEGRFSLDWEKV
jgi:predicted Rossmann-fold nucleotide-binding protein